MKSIVTDDDMNIKEVFVQVGDPDKEHKEMAKKCSLRVFGENTGIFRR